VNKELKRALAFVELCCTHYGDDEQGRRADRFIEEHAEAIKAGLRLGSLIAESMGNGHGGGMYWHANDDYRTVGVYVDELRGTREVNLGRGHTIVDALRSLDEEPAT